jgi:dihydrofolate reductase
MGKLRFRISISLDGFIAGPNQSEEHPLGEGGEGLHEWAFELAAWRKPHGREGGEVNASSEVVERMEENVGAQLMGRGMFGGGRGPWPEDPPWNGWWGEDPPFHCPVFVLTHHERQPLELSDTTFHFVTEGVEAAVARAKEAAGDEDVLLGGGAETARQCLAAGLVDEMQLALVPILLGSGEQLFEGLDPELGFEQIEAIDAPGVTHLTYAQK